MEASWLSKFVQLRVVEIFERLFDSLTSFIEVIRSGFLPCSWSRRKNFLQQPIRHFSIGIFKIALGKKENLPIQDLGSGDYSRISEEGH